MKVRLLLFASARRAVGVGELTLQTRAGARVVDLLADERLSALLPQAAVLRFAVNEEFAAPERALCDGDVVAVIPPVSGG